MEHEIIIANNFGEATQMLRGGYITHAFCRGGDCLFDLDGRKFSLAKGDCMILPQQTAEFAMISSSPDFAVDVIYVASGFIQVATPLSNYGMRGHLALFEDPVMHLTDEQQAVCALNFDYIRHRLSLPQHHFHRDAMLNAVQCMIIDFFDFHVELFGEADVSGQPAQLMHQFLDLLEEGNYRQHRAVGWYADRLCVTPKYLSEVSKRISGQAAVYWITRYTSLDIARQLRSTDLTVDQLADLYCFTSTNYFSRYVQKNLGAPPSALRE